MQRVPTNSHPSYLATYAADGPPPALPDAPRSDRNNDFLGLANFPSRDSFHTIGPSSMRSFASSYARTSALYMADNLSIASRTNSAAHPYNDAAYDASKMEDGRALLGDTNSVMSSMEGLSFFPALSRHTTAGTVILKDEFNDSPHHASSSFAQSVFNSINVLVGICVLALPLGMRYSGWIAGSVVFLFCTLSTNYSAKILARCLDAAPPEANLTYGDMGAAAFGEKGRKMISTVFILELMTIGVAMIILLGDGLETCFELEQVPARVAAFALLTPTLFLPISKLAYTSVIGVISSTFLIVLVVYDGLSKTEHPGSLHDPLPTNMWPDYATLPLSFGIFMAGYSGHAVFPSIYRDMAQPKEYTRVVDYTYLITFVLYMTMITTGYLMFGNDIMQEITRNLAVTEGYSVWLNHAAAYINLLMPIAKYGLMLNPIVVSGELWLQSKGGTEDDTLPSWLYAPVSFLGRVALSACILVISIAIPGFDRVIALLGALFSYGISVIFPLACYIKLYRKDFSFHALYANWALLLVSAVLAIIGTVWSFIPL